MSGRVNGERQGVVRSTSAALPGKNVPGLANPIKISENRIQDGVRKISGTYPLLLPAHDHALLQTSGLMSIQPKRPNHQKPSALYHIDRDRCRYSGDMHCSHNFTI
jgi:hypothetical protein